MRQPRPPLKVIMRATGLSRSTVDRVLNGRKSVHPQTQAAVDAALQQLANSSYASIRTDAIKLVRHYKTVVQVGDAFTQSIVDEVNRLAPQLASRDCTLEVITCVGMPNEGVAEIIHEQTQADGLLIIAKNTPGISDAAAILRAQGKAIVTSHTDLDLVS